MVVTMGSSTLLPKPLDYADIDNLKRNLAQILLPQKKVIASEHAGENFYLPEGTRYDPSLTPYMLEPMNLVFSRDKRAVIFVSSARTSKSLSLVDALISVIIPTRPSDILLILATADMAKRYAKTRLDRMIQNSSVLKPLLSTDRHNDNVMNKMFVNGSSVWVGSPTPTNLSASDYRYCFWSDVDRGQPTNSDGDIFAQLMKRNQTFLSSGLTVCESSPSHDLLDPHWKPKTPHEAPPTTGIFALYNQGDRRMFYWQCPHHSCGERFKVSASMDLFCLPDDNSLLKQINESSPYELANKYNRIYCPDCGGEISPEHKTNMNNDGIWRKEFPDVYKPFATFWLSGLCAKFQNWQEILEKYFSALQHYDDTGDESKLRAFYNVDLGSFYIPRNISEMLNPEELFARTIPSERGVVPYGVRYIVATVDVQSSSFVVQFVGFGVDNRSWVIDRFNITKNDDGKPIRPATYLEDWDLLIDKVMLRKFALATDPNSDFQGEMGVTLTLCDSGGAYSATSDSSVTENAYAFWRNCDDVSSGLKNKLVLVKGTRPSVTTQKQAVTKSLLTKASSTARKTSVVGRLPLYLLNTTMLKDTVVAMAKRTEDGAGYMTFGDWLNFDFFKELCAEIRTEKGWTNTKSRRNETFDLYVYALAGVYILREGVYKSTIDWDNPPMYALPWETNPMVTSFTEEVYEPKLRPETIRRVRNATNATGTAR